MVLMTTSTPTIGEGSYSITPTLVIRSAAKAIEFYKKAFGAQERLRIPGPDGKILHAEMRIGDSIFYIFDESPNFDNVKSPQSLGVCTAILNVHVANADETFKQAIAAGGKVSMPVTDQFWGDRYGSFVDPFGCVWGVSTRKQNLSPEEVERRAQEYFARLAPMRWELTHAGILEARTPQDVEDAVHQRGTLMVVVNSICGCAAARMRPGVRAAIRGGVRPDRMITVFAGQDRDATEAARRYFAGYPPSSPSIALLRDGQLLYMMQRSEIEISDPMTVAARLKEAFEKYCVEKQ
jgi:putative YphP/YqiW family bacilliredoxin